jgi:hypothetical protein
MTNIRQKNTEISDRRAKVAELYLRGVRQTQIAADLDVNQATISRDLAALRDEWLQSALVDLDQFKAKELAKIDELEREAWDAYRRSEGDFEKTVSNLVTDEHGERKYNVRNFKFHAFGDPRYLQQIAWCIDKRCKILGLDAPTRSDFTSDDKPITMIEVIKSYAPQDGELSG